MVREDIDAVALFYFSGTGNTEVLAECYATAFRQMKVNTDVLALERFTRKGEPPAVEKYDLMGIGYPIHAFNAPRIVFEFIDLLPAGKGRRVFLFRCPGDHFAGGGSTLPVRRRLLAKGYKVIREDMLVMPANFLVAYPPALAKELFHIAERRIGNYVREILAGAVRLQRNTVGARICTLLSPLERFGTRMARLHFHIRPSCTGCGLCAARCPSGNITMHKKRPVFHWRCLVCLRCIYLCPVRAIGMRGLNRLLFKDGYNIRGVLADKGIPAAYLKPGMKGFFRRFVAYAREPSSSGK